MRGLTQLLLLLLAVCLTLWLILGFWPLGTGSRVALSTLAILLSGSMGYFQWRRHNHKNMAYAHIEDTLLPPEEFQGAVVLVCGDSASLFSASIPYRETRQGWYLPVEQSEQLPLLAQHLAAERPALLAQISVLLAVVPEQHKDNDDFIQSLRSWHRAIVQCKGWLAGIPPVWVSVWVSPPLEETLSPEERWYTVTPGQKDVQVQEPGSGFMPLVDWSHILDSSTHPERLSTAFWMENLLSWLHTHV